VTEAPLGENGDEDEAVAAFTTPWVMISLILLTAPGERGNRKPSVSSCDVQKTSTQIFLNTEKVRTVDELSRLSLDMQIQRPIPERKEQKGRVNRTVEAPSRL